MLTSLNWVAVDSTFFTRAAYDKREHQLYLRFHSGKVYRYFEFPAYQCDEFLRCGVSGQVFRRAYSRPVPAKKRCAPPNRAVTSRVFFASSLFERMMADKPHPEMGHRRCLGVLRLAGKYSHARMEAAAERVLVTGV
jgi:hypothetical protein